MKSSLFRLLLTFLICLISNSICGQFHSVSDSLTSPTGAWVGDTAWMNFSSEGLRSAAPSAGSLTWRRPSKAGLGGQWRLEVTMEFNPSSSNYCEFRFLENNGNYYAIQLGGTSSDNISLILHTTYKDSILAFVPKYLDQSNPHIALKILRDTAAKFEVYDADSLLFSCTDSTLMRSESLSIYARYTSSRVDKFLFSTLLAEGYDFPDTLGPQILKSDVIDPFTLEIEWDEWCQTIGNTSTYLLKNGVFLDTLTITNHYDRFWHAESNIPLPHGSFDIILPPSVDAENNVNVGANTKVIIAYPGPKSCWITAIHPFENYGGYFIDVQSDQAVANTLLRILEKDGETKTYTLNIDSGLTHFDALKLPKEGVLSIEKDGIVLTLQPYTYAFLPHQELGDFYLRSDSLTGLSTQFHAVPLSLYTPQEVPEGTLPSLKPIAYFTDAQGQIFSEFAEPVWPYLDQLNPSPLNKAYDPLRPFLLPTGLQLPKSLGDTSLIFKAPEYADSSLLFLSEVHFDPKELYEFIELFNPNDFPIVITQLQLEKQPLTGISDVKLLPLHSAEYNGRETLSPLLLPEGYLALQAPFSLPNESTDLTLYGPYGVRIDGMAYAPWESPLYSKHSAERISFGVSGMDSLNWSPHHFSDLTPTEATPNAPNSVSHIGLIESVKSMRLSVTHLSYDPLHYKPTTMLVINTHSDAILSVMVYSSDGYPIAQPYQQLHLSAGQQQVEIRPVLWDNKHPKSGIYFIHAHLIDQHRTTREILPFSVYNP